MCFEKHDPLLASTQHCTLIFEYAMVTSGPTIIAPATKVAALCDARGSMLLDEQQRSKRYPNILSPDGHGGGCRLEPMVQALSDSLESWPCAVSPLIASEPARVSVPA